MRGRSLPLGRPEIRPVMRICVYVCIVCASMPARSCAQAQPIPQAKKLHLLEINEANVCE